jgi:hypothetical protein
MAAVLLTAVLAGPAALAQNSFHFSDSEREAQEAQIAREQRAQELVSVPCKARLKNQKILVLVGEQLQSGWQADQARFTPFKESIDRRLKALGLRTYTQEEIKKQVAQAEIDAYFKNDPDAALAASRRLAASYILRGDIVTRQNINQALGIPEVAVTLSFTLTSAGGRLLSHVDARSESYSGSDTLRRAQILVEEQAGEIVGHLYHDYCSSGAT